jgi:hypothetical protein
VDFEGLLPEVEDLVDGLDGVDVAEDLRRSTLALSIIPGQAKNFETLEE